MVGNVLLIVSIRRADRCLVEVSGAQSGQLDSLLFQSAVRIAVWLKQDGPVSGALFIGFQSAVRIAVWLKFIFITGYTPSGGVSIRRADRCLVEAAVANRQQLQMWCFNPPCGSLFG